MAVCCNPAMTGQALRNKTGAAVPGTATAIKGFPPCIEGSFTCMNNVTVHTADLLY